MKPEVDQPANPLFTNGENHQMNACVGDNGGPYELFHYAEGFFEAGHAAVDAAKAYTAPLDFLIYPAAFSYRHAIELMLKQLVQSLHLVLETGDTFVKNHRMSALWDDVMNLTAAHGETLMDPKAVERAGVIIGHFNDFDPTGQVFRYPEGIRGNRHLSEHKLINVEVLRDYMREIQEILKAWYYEVKEFRQWQLEQLAEYRTDV